MSPACYDCEASAHARYGALQYLLLYIGLVYFTGLASRRISTDIQGAVWLGSVRICNLRLYCVIYTDFACTIHDFSKLPLATNNGSRPYPVKGRDHGQYRRVLYTQERSQQSSVKPGPKLMSMYLPGHSTDPSSPYRMLEGPIDALCRMDESQGQLYFGVPAKGVQLSTLSVCKTVIQESRGTSQVQPTWSEVSYPPVLFPSSRLRPQLLHQRAASLNRIFIRQLEMRQAMAMADPEAWCGVRIPLSKVSGLRATRTKLLFRT